MDELVHFVGVLLRFPFFVVGIIFWTLFIFMVYAIGSIASIILIPFKFIEAAWKNDTSILESWIKDELNWRGFSKGHRDLYAWWLKENGSEKNN